MAKENIFELISPKVRTTFREVSIIVGADGKDTTQTKDILTLDATLSMNLKSDANSTDHPIEKGADISDNINLKPLIYTIKGKIVNNPLSLANIAASLGSSTIGALGGASTKSALAQFGASKVTGWLMTESNGGRLKRAITALQELQSNKKLFTIVTKLTTLNNVHLQSIEIDQDNKSGDSINFSGTLKQLRIIESDTVKTSRLNIDPGVAAGAEKTQDQGSKKAIEKDSSFLDSLKKKSILKNIFG